MLFHQFSNIRHCRQRSMGLSIALLPLPNMPCYICVLCSFLFGFYPTLRFAVSEKPTAVALVDYLPQTFLFLFYHEAVVGELSDSVSAHLMKIHIPAATTAMMIARSIHAQPPRSRWYSSSIICLCLLSVFIGLFPYQFCKASMRVAVRECILLAAHQVTSIRVLYECMCKHPVYNYPLLGVL